jgi:membrane protease YdiL (CAAX protease family)
MKASTLPRPASPTALTALLMLGCAMTVALQTASPARAVMLLAVAPWLEEAVFRAGLQEHLLRSGRRPWLCIGLTALAFAAAHMLAWQQWSAAVLVLPALALGTLYQRTRSVTACAAAHAAMNGVWLALSARGLHL